MSWAGLLFVLKKTFLRGLKLIHPQVHLGWIGSLLYLGVHAYDFLGLFDGWEPGKFGIKHFSFE